MDTKNKPPYAFIIGLDCITGLQSARILARHGIPVVGLAKGTGHFCCRTRVCEKIVQANTAGEEYIALLESMGPTLDRKAVLFPCTDMSVLTLSRNRQRLEKWYHIALPRPEVVEILMDKVSFYTYAAKEGLAIPRTYFLISRNDAEAAASELTYPCILKPPMKTPTWEKNTRAKVNNVASRQEFLALYDRCSGWADLLMVQEWIEGNDADLYSFRGATLGGNGPEVLKAIDKVGSDLGFSIGTCGKDSQGVPVTDAMPTIRIPEIIVGGVHE